MFQNFFSCIKAAKIALLYFLKQTRKQIHVIKIIFFEQKMNFYRQTNRNVLGRKAVAPQIAKSLGNICPQKYHIWTERWTATSINGSTACTVLSFVLQKNLSVSRFSSPHDHHYFVIEPEGWIVYLGKTVLSFSVFGYATTCLLPENLFESFLFGPVLLSVFFMHVSESSRSWFASAGAP